MTTCEATRDLVAEVALGIAAGDERAAVLRHTATCATCRRLIESLSATVDVLTLVSPPAAPPADFETAVLDRLSAPEHDRTPVTTARGTPTPARPRRGGRVAAGAIAAAAALILLLAGTTFGRVTAASGRAGQLLDASRTTVGEVAAGVTTSAPTTPEPWPSYMAVFVYPGAPAGEYRVQCTFEAHGRIEQWEAGALTVTAGKAASLAVTMPFAVDDLRDVRLEPVSGGRAPLVASTSPI
jgi:hypothetical protein